MQSILVNDFVIFEELCNFRCEYCKGEMSNYIINDNYLIINDKRIDIAKVYYQSRLVLKRIRNIFGTEILKVSGGEISILPGFIEFIKEESGNYKKIQVLTNASNNLDWLQRLHQNIPNLLLQISLDGHTLEMNKARRLTVNQLTNVKESVSYCIQNNLPLEINCVINKYNISNIAKYIEWINDLNSNCVWLNLFPVRGIEHLYPSIDEINKTFSNLKSMEETIDRICPIEYIFELEQFMLSGKRSYNCLIPFYVIGSYHTGEIGSCTCSRNSPRIGNVLTETEAEIKARFNKMSFYKQLRNGSEFDFCKGCFIHYDLLSLYELRLLQSEKIKSNPFYL